MTPILAAILFVAGPVSGLHGTSTAATGSKLARGGKPPARLRADSFVPGTLSDDPLPALRPTRPPFVHRRADFPDAIDIVFLANARPVRVRATIRRNGKPLAEIWEGHVRTLFAGFDRDGDGRLNRLEADHLFSARGVSVLLGGTYYYRSLDTQQSFEAADRDDDGRLSIAEVQTLYAPAAVGLLRPQFVPVATPNAERLTKELFAKLDLNHDGRLTRDEMSRIEHILTVNDADEDECLSPIEIFPDLFDDARQQRPATAATIQSPAKPPPDLYVSRDVRPGVLTQMVIKKYDRDGDFQLTRSEIGLPPAEFDPLDTDHNGKLTAAEIEAWRTGPADFVATLDIGKTAADCRATVAPRAGPVAGVELRPGKAGRSVLRIGTQFLDLSATPATGGQQNQAAVELLNAYPANKPFVREEDLAGPQNQFLRIVFDSADANGDGKLTRAEYKAYLDLQQSTIDLALSVTFATRTPSLFNLLDADGDGRLSVRELRTAFDRLIVLEPAGGDAVTVAAIQPSAGVRAVPSSGVGADAGSTVSPFVPDRAGPRKGPIWFVRMDNNNDGDVSRGEFLGTKADFDRIDADRDGLISLAEAEAFDKAVRK